jgi:hypothetical protein
MPCGKKFGTWARRLKEGIRDPCNIFPEHHLPPPQVAKNSRVLKKLRETPRQLLYSAVKKCVRIKAAFAAAQYPQSDTNGNANDADLADFRRSNPCPRCHITWVGIANYPEIA